MFINISTHDIVHVPASILAIAKLLWNMAYYYYVIDYVILVRSFFFMLFLDKRQQPITPTAQKKNMKEMKRKILQK